jgi:molecular chaperone IbpA|tara:strand:+ start:1486 stop:1881 length:396 start_codon:yes stop_codon:yes gene_type:complete
MNELDILRNHFLGYHNNFFDNFKTVSTYPPYNIRGNEEKGVIEMALAGFTKDDLNVEVKDNLLTITGKKEKKAQDDIWHKGISERNFAKRFQLHEHVIVDDADLKDGILTVNYHREVPESEKPKQIKIKSN